METLNLRGKKRTAKKDARRAVMLLQQAEELIKSIRNGERLEYVNYIDEVNKLSIKKVGVITVATFLGSVPIFLQHDFYGIGTELLVMAGIPVLGACGIYNVEDFSHILSPVKMFKARQKQRIENNLHQICILERKQKEADILWTLGPLIKELNYSLNKANRVIKYDPESGKFSVKTALRHQLSLGREAEIEPSSKWDNIYLLAVTGTDNEKLAVDSIPRVNFSPDLMERSNPSIEEAIAIIRHTESILKAELGKTKDSSDNSWAPRDPSNPEYMLKERSLINSAQPALDSLNRAMNPNDGKVVYNAGTRFPVFNVSQPTGEKQPELLPVPAVKTQRKPLSKWENIYMLTATNGNGNRSTSEEIPPVVFSPDLLKQDSLSIEEAITVLRHTENILKEKLDNTKDEIGVTDPKNIQYLKEERRALTKSQMALDTINHAMNPSHGKLAYTAGTRFPNFNISQATNNKTLDKWGSMEKVIAETVSLGRISALDNLKALESAKAN